MKTKIYPFLILFSVVLTSILIVILPTFFTKGVSRITVDKEISLPLILDDNKTIKLLFFGYSGCSDICTPRLYDISEFYNQLTKKERNSLGVEFLDISIPDDKTLPLRFAQFFNPDFKGIFLEEKNLRDYTKEFNVYFSKSLLDETEYDHTAHLYLVTKKNKKKTIRYLYNSYPYDFEQIHLDIKELLNE